MRQQPWDDTFGIPYPGLNSSIAEAIGLPSGGCEFGACGNSFASGGSGSTPLSDSLAKLKTTAWFLFFLTRDAALPSIGICDEGAFTYIGGQGKGGFAGNLGDYSAHDGGTNNVLGERGNVGVAGGQGGVEGLYFIPAAEAGGALIGVSKRGLSVGGYAGTPED